MKKTIVTNNPVVYEKFNNVYFVKGSYEDVLIKVRDFVHEGYELISHPLGASARMLFSPYRSIIIGEKKEKIDLLHVEIIENSISNYRKNMMIRVVDTANSKDYALVDFEHLEATLNV